MRSILIMLVLLVATSAPAQIGPSRARQIQEALRRYGIAVRVTGAMDAQTLQALKDLQKENHWQTHRIPDARVLDLIGLGAKHNNFGDERVMEARR